MNQFNSGCFAGQRHWPQQYFQRLMLEPPGLYQLSATPPEIFVATAPDLVTRILSGAEGAIVKGPMPAKVRRLLGDGTAASWFPPESPIETRPSSNLDSEREQKGIVASKFLHVTETASKGIIKRHASEFSQCQSSNKPIDIYAAMHDLVFHIAVECLFKNELTKELLDANRCIHRSGPALHRHLRSYWGLYVPYFDRTYVPRTELWRWLPGSHFNALRARRRAVEKIADHLMSNDNSISASTSNPMQSVHQRRSATIGLLFASYENIASACAWAIWCLATHSEWQDRVAAEIAATSEEYANSASLLSYRPLLSAILHETLRLYPPVWSIGRVVTQPIRIGHHELLHGSSIIVSPWLQHRHPALWEDSEHFQPERFLSGQSFEGVFLPFGAEPHACPGEGFSWLTLAIALAEMLKLWRFIPAEGSFPQPMFGLTQRPENEIRIRFARRA